MYVGLQAQRDFYKTIDVRNAAGVSQTKYKKPKIDTFRVNVGWTF